MKNFLLFTIIISIVACNKPITITAKKKQLIEKRIDSIYSKYNLKGDFIFAIIDKDGLQFSHGISTTRNWSNNEDVNNQPFYIASHTKALTGTLLKLLENDKVIDLNKSINDYLPELHFQEQVDNRNISIKNLLSHNNGIHGGLSTWKTAHLGFKDNNELISIYNTYSEVDSVPEFSYTNHGPIIATIISEKLTGKSWKNQMKERLFSPLGMHQTSGYLEDFDSVQILPSIMSNGAKIIHQGFFKSNNTLHSSGGLISTVNDLSKWLQYNINKGKLNEQQISPEETFNELHEVISKQKRKYFTYDRYGYSLGWDLATYNKDTLLTRFGGYGGISFHLSFMPSKNIGIIAFSNEDRAIRLPHLIANYAYNLIQEKENTNSLFTKETKELFRILEIIETKNNNFTNTYSTLNYNNNLPLSGIYKNTVGWPDVEIVQEKNKYKMKWGKLTGTIYKLDSLKNNYNAILGVKSRTFKISKKGDSLFSGNLIFLKQY